MFENLGLNTNEVDGDIEEEQEYVAGSSKRLGQGAHMCVIDMAYQMESQGGAIGVSFKVTAENGMSKSFTLYATSGTEKGRKISYTFTDRNGNQKTQYMKGYLQIRAIAFAALGTDDTNPSEREIDVYDWDLKQDVKQRKQVYIDLIGKPVMLMFREKLEDDWKDSTKSTTKIELEHVANATTMLTRAEVKGGKTEPVILEQFKAAIEKDPVLDKRKNSKGGAPTGTVSTSTASF